MLSTSLARFIHKGLSIKCANEEEALQLVNFAQQEGFKWRSGESCEYNPKWLPNAAYTFEVRNGNDFRIGYGEGMEVDDVKTFAYSDLILRPMEKGLLKSN